MATPQVLGLGVRFFCVARTGKKWLPMGALSVLRLEEWGEHISYAHTTADGVTDTMAVVWVSRERSHFISSASNTLSGTLYDCARWRHFEDDAERVMVTVACWLCWRKMT